MLLELKEAEVARRTRPVVTVRRLLGVIVSSVLLITSGCIAESHIEANVPRGKSFDEYLNRDLTSYFCKGAKDCRVEYELLRKGPTQTGIAYPKYYLWAKCFSGSKLTTEGAVRAAAIEQSRFDVTDFLSAKEIVASPERVGQVFPAPLVDNIINRARHR